MMMMDEENRTEGPESLTLVIQQITVNQLEYVVNRFFTFGVASMNYNEHLKASIIRMATGRLADHVEDILRENGYQVERRSNGNVTKTGWQQVVSEPNTTTTSTSMTTNTNGLNISHQKNLNQISVYDMTETQLPLPEELTTFLSQVTLSRRGFNSRLQLLRELEEVLHFGKIHPFGSFINGLAGPESDVDIYFQDERQGRTKIKKKTIIAHVATALRHAVSPNNGSLLGKVILVLPNIRVPLVRFVHGETKIQLDISFENMMSVQNSNLIKFMISLHPIARPFTMFLCHWARSHGLVFQNGLKSYAIGLLSIVFLMRKNMLPSIQLLQSLCPPYTIDDGWNVAFCDDESIVRTAMRRQNIGAPTEDVKPFDILTLVVQFFDMIKSISSSKCFVSSQTGDFIPIGTSKKDKGFPFRRGRADAESSSGRFCLQDPFDLSSDVMRPCRDDVFPLFFQAMSATSDRIKSRNDQQQHDKEGLLELSTPKNVIQQPLDGPKEMKRSPKVISQRLLDAKAAWDQIKSSLPPPLTFTLTYKDARSYHLAGSSQYWKKDCSDQLKRLWSRVVLAFFKQRIGLGRQFNFVDRTPSRVLKGHDATSINNNNYGDPDDQKDDEEEEEHDDDDDDSGDDEQEEGRQFMSKISVQKFSVEYEFTLLGSCSLIKNNADTNGGESELPSSGVVTKKDRKRKRMMERIANQIDLSTLPMQEHYNFFLSVTLDNVKRGEELRVTVNIHKLPKIINTTVASSSQDQQRPQQSNLMFQQFSARMEKSVRHEFGTYAEQRLERWKRLETRRLNKRLGNNVPVNDKNRFRPFQNSNRVKRLRMM